MPRYIIINLHFTYSIYLLTYKPRAIFNKLVVICDNLSM